MLEPLAGREPRAALLLGQVRLRQGDREVALRQFKAAGDDLVAAVALSRLAAADGETRTALRYSAAAARLLPANPAVVQLHAANLIQRKKWDEAKELLLKLVERDPVDAVTMRLLSLAARKSDERGRWSSAMQALLKQTSPPANLDAELERLGWRKETK